MARGTAARFGARLAAAGLVVVVGVILATDPLAAKPFGTAWPLAAVHYLLIPHYALIGVHLAVVAVAATAVALCAARDRGRPADGHLLPGAAAVGGAILGTVALRFGLSADAAYPALAAVSGGLVWFGMTRADGLVSGVSRPRAVPSRDTGTGYYDRSAGGTAGAGSGDGQWESSQWPAGPWTGQDASDRTGGRAPANGAAGARGRSGPGEPGRSRAAAQPGEPGQSRAAAQPAEPGRSRAAAQPGDAAYDWVMGPGPHGPPGAVPATAGIGRPGSAQPGSAQPGSAQPGSAQPGSAQPGSALSRRPAPGEVPSGAPAGDAVRPVARPYGLIAIYTLLEDRVADFDRIAEQAAEQVRASEPDTLVYVIHTVPKAPMQRIFYEVYRDRAAYEQHEQQPYVKRFVTARRPYVLATNVIELRLKYAKVSPLVQAEAPVRAPAGTLPAAGPAAPGPAPARPAPGGPGQRGYGGI